MRWSRFETARRIDGLLQRRSVLISPLEDGSGLGGAPTPAEA
jgi:hypothetical protein